MHLRHDERPEYLRVEQTTIVSEVTQQHDANVHVTHVENLGELRHNVLLEERHGKQRVDVTVDVVLGALDTCRRHKARLHVEEREQSTCLKIEN